MESCDRFWVIFSNNPTFNIVNFANSDAFLIAPGLEVVKGILEPCLFGSLVGTVGLLSTVFHHMAPQITCLFG